MAKKFYAVVNGRSTGIYEDWESCEKNVKGYSNAKYKGFNKKSDAINYLENGGRDTESAENSFLDITSGFVKNYESGESHSVRFYPPMEEIRNECIDIPEGEKALLKFLSESANLPDNLEVYFQYNLLGTLPDIMLIRKGYGALIIEVKDYSLALYSRKTSEKWYVEDSQGVHEFRSPLAQVKRYKQLFLKCLKKEYGAAAIRKKRFRDAVSTAVFFHGSKQEEIQKFRPPEEMAEWEKRTDVVGDEILSSPEEFRKFLDRNHLIEQNTSPLFAEEVYDKLKECLPFSEQSAMELAHVNLSRRQRELSESIGGIQQKIRGLAGCGKTTVLAHRALDAYRKTGKPVLILTFNITLCHYIRAYINTIRDNENMNMFIIKHYHGFIKDYSYKYDCIMDEDDYTLLEVRKRFKTILVDETQDYEKAWIECIRKLLDDDGELCFFADEKQHVYKRENFIDDGEEKQKRIYTGIGGNWNKLSVDNKSFRLNGKIAELAQQFLANYYTDYNDNKIISGESNLFDTSSVEYYSLHELDLTFIMNVFQETLEKHNGQIDDIVFLSSMVEPVRKIDKEIRDRYTYQTLTTFESEEKYNKLNESKEGEELQNALKRIRRSKKLEFYMESDKVKLSTVHSFKGWGVDTVIFILEADDDKSLPPTRELIFTAMTRAKEHLVIINIGNKEYDKFFKEYIQ